ncbi:MAG: hypothetical protein OEY58_19755 [Gammaproteobacteria bacterium]|nr:hypothetical protein [Gammaproteobacteria bacterium]
MNGLSNRLKLDISKIEDLGRATNGKVQLLSTSGSPINRISLRLDYQTAPSSSYPKKIQDTTEVDISILGRYPFVEPAVTIKTPIFHPNVYGTGKICFGTKWMPSHGMDLLIKRIIKILIFDTTILNKSSPANVPALKWYERAIRQYPTYFPTASFVETQGINNSVVWKSDTNDGKTLVSCDKCSASLRVPAGKTLNITCPSCGSVFRMAT